MHNYVVIGGGVAGICCVEELARLCPVASTQITLISASTFIKGIANFVKITDVLETFDIEEQDLFAISSKYPNVKVIHAAVKEIEPNSKEIYLDDGSKVLYDKVCICSGAVPNIVVPHERVIGLRDTAQSRAVDMQTVEQLAKLITGARRIVVLGNGGIALGLVHELTDVDIVWAVRNSYVGNTFFDASASAFFLDSSRFEIQPPGIHNTATHEVEAEVFDYHADVPIAADKAAEERPDELGEFVPTYAVLPKRQRRVRYATTQPAATSTDNTHNSSTSSKRMRTGDSGRAAEGGAVAGSSLGPSWVDLLRSKVPHEGSGEERKHKVSVEISTGLVRVHDDISTLPSNIAICGDAEGWPCYAELTNGKVYGCDLVISATGVVPSAPFLPLQCGSRQFERYTDGGLLVNRWMQTTGSADIYAAGDVASVVWPLNQFASGDATVWFQMRLWNQARLQGLYAARSMSANLDPLELEGGGLHFQMFAHMTHFLGYKVVLLGAFNGQGLGEDYLAAISGQVVKSTGLERTAGATCVSDAASTSTQRVQVQVRVTPHSEYIKVVVVDGRIVGAMLIGDTDLEETMENLILNGITLTSGSGEILDLLNPDVDIEDYFD